MKLEKKIDGIDVMVGVASLAIPHSPFPTYLFSVPHPIPAHNPIHVILCIRCIYEARPEGRSLFPFSSSCSFAMPLISLPELRKQRISCFASLILTYSLIAAPPASHHQNVTCEEEETIHLIYSRDPSCLLSVSTVLVNWLKDVCIYCLYWGNAGVVAFHHRSACPTPVDHSIVSFIRQLAAASRKQVRETANCWKCLLPDPSTQGYVLSLYTCNTANDSQGSKQLMSSMAVRDVHTIRTSCWSPWLLCGLCQTLLSNRPLPTNNLSPQLTKSATSSPK